MKLHLEAKQIPKHLKKYFKPIQIKRKDNALVPQRLVIALQDFGWYVRSEIIWNKVNSLPSSVKDRPTQNHEYILMLTKQPKYWSDFDAIRTPHKQTSKQRAIRGINPNKYNQNNQQYLPVGSHAMSINKPRSYHSVDSKETPSTNDEETLNQKIEQGETTLHPMGANIRTVWTFPTKGFSVKKLGFSDDEIEQLKQSGNADHYATFPLELPRRCILASCPEKCCPHCGQGWKRTTHVDYVKNHDPRSRGDDNLNQASGSTDYRGNNLIHVSQTIGWEPSCTCNHDEEDCIPGIALDPFLGSGTTAMVAAQLGRNTIGVELNDNYVKIAKQRITQDAPMLNCVDVVSC